MATGEEIGKDYKTLMPALTDDADIQEAFTMYHYGLTSYTGIEPIPEDSIEGHFGTLETQISDLEARPIGGGEVSPNEPTAVGPEELPVPNGYIWVDNDDISNFSTAWPTVIYSPTDPSASLTMADIGTLWIDENDTTGVLNVNNYLTTASANTTLATITSVSSQIQGVSNQIQDVQNSLAFYSPLNVSFSQQNASYTLVLSDAAKQVEIASGSATTLTVPTNDNVPFPIGTAIVVVQAGAGQVTVAGASGVTVNATPGLKLRAQWSVATLVKRATNTWLLTGDVAA